MTKEEKQFNQWFDWYADGVKVFEEADMKQAYLQGRATLEKENAELKEELKKWKDEWQEQVQKATDEGYARTLQTMQLTKAKEIIKSLLETPRTVYKRDREGEVAPYESMAYARLKEEAEQFLNSEGK